MYAFLPEAHLRDCRDFWYLSQRRPMQRSLYLDTTLRHSTLDDGGVPGGSGGGPGNNSASRAAIEQSILGRLRADELCAERRRAQISNLGSTWLKPPGVTKTLFQLREEQREAEEHAEFLRREQLHQELADAADAAAAAAVAAAGGTEDAGVDLEDDMMMDQEEGERDLDDEIPDADGSGFGYDGASDEDENEEDDVDDEDEDNQEEEEEEGEDDVEDDDEEAFDNSYARQSGQGGRSDRRGLQGELANRMAAVRATEDRMREMMVRRQSGRGNFYGVEEEPDDEDQAHILEEDDLILSHQHEMEPGTDMNMDADLDDDIPEAENSGYEHTDSDASLSSDEDGAPNASSVGRAPRPSRYLAGLPPGGSVQASMDYSGIFSRDESSIMESSPEVRRRD